jgi:hypothetical protein
MLVKCAWCWLVMSERVLQLLAIIVGYFFCFDPLVILVYSGLHVIQWLRFLCLLHSSSCFAAILILKKVMDHWLLVLDLVLTVYK